MSVDGLFVIICMVIGVTVFFTWLLISGDVEEAAQNFKQEQTKSGEGSLSDLYLGLSPELFLTLRLFFAGLLFLIGFAGLGIVFGIFFGVGGFVMPGMLLKRIKRQRVIKVEEQLVGGLELLGNCLRSGLTLQQALELLVRELPPPISQEFSIVLAETRLGVDLIAALSNMAKRLDSTIVAILATGIAVTKRCGGDLTEIFQNISSTISEQANIEGKLNAVTAQGRFQGLILGIMPFALIVVLYFVDPAHVNTLFGYQMGLWAVASVVIMVGLAQLWIRKLLTIDV
jgi:tight adherence protein B